MKLLYAIGDFMYSDETKFPYWMQNMDDRFFSVISNYIDFEFPMSPIPAPLINRVPQWRVNWRLTIDEYFIGKISEDFENSFSFTTKLGLAVGSLDNVEWYNRVNGEISYNIRVPFLDHIFITGALGYKGSDNYNIFFEDSFSYFEIGMSIKPYRFFNTQIKNMVNQHYLAKKLSNSNKTIKPQKRTSLNKL